MTNGLAPFCPHKDIRDLVARLEEELDTKIVIAQEVTNVFTSSIPSTYEVVEKTYSIIIPITILEYHNYVRGSNNA